MRTSTNSLIARLGRSVGALALMGTIVAGASVSPAFAGGRRGPHEGYAPASAVPYDNGRAVLYRKARPGVVVAPAGAPVVYARPRRARAYNGPVYASGPYYNGGYYDPYAGTFPTYNPAYTYDPNYRRSDHGRDAVTIVAGTAGGAVVGGLMGGKKGAIIGGVIGAAASAVVAAHTNRNDRYYPY